MQPLGMSFQANQEMQRRGSKKEIHHEAISHGDAKFKRAEVARNIWRNFWSPLSTYYISFRSSGSQESNASNGVQIRVETKKLWPFEGNCAKLRRNFASHFPDAKFFALPFPDAKIFALPFPNEKFSHHLL